MNHQDKFERIQRRAYEIYLHRDERSGTAEADWYAAEREIEYEERLQHTGPARIKERSHWNQVTTHRGEDIENPA